MLLLYEIGVICYVYEAPCQALYLVPGSQKTTIETKHAQPEGFCTHRRILLFGHIARELRVNPVRRKRFGQKMLVLQIVAYHTAAARTRPRHSTLNITQPLERTCELIFPPTGYLLLSSCCRANAEQCVVYAQVDLVERFPDSQ